MINKSFFISFFLLICLILINLNVVFAADIWSEPTYTEQWSIPENTEIWTEPTYTEPDIPKPQTEAVIESQTYIKLQIGSKDVKIKDSNLQLDVAPSIINGRTMVPIRFIGEALNATFTWDGDTQQVTFIMGDKTIILFINESFGLVNGRKVELDVPPLIQNGRTLVPLRFVSENLELYIKYIEETKSIEISNKPLEIAESTENVNDIKQDDEDNAIVDFEKLYGTWYIWTPGSTTNLYDTNTGSYVTHDYTQGVDQGKVIINTDGTYSMTHAAWAKGVTAEGNWRLSYPSEINGEKIIAIVLQNGLTDVDWAVAPSQNGKIRLLYAMRWTDGSATWVFDSELYK